MPDDVAPECTDDCEGTRPGHLTGYAAGNYVTYDRGEYSTDDQDGNVEYGTVANHRASEVDFAFNDDGETFSASHRLHVAEPGAPSQGGIEINYSEGQAVNIDTGPLFAFTGRDGITIFRDGDVPAPPVGDGGFAVLAGSDFFGEAPPGRSPRRFFHQWVPRRQSGTASGASALHRLLLYEMGLVSSPRQGSMTAVTPISRTRARLRFSAFGSRAISRTSTTSRSGVQRRIAAAPLAQSRPISSATARRHTSPRAT